MQLLDEAALPTGPRKRSHMDICKYFAEHNGDRLPAVCRHGAETPGGLSMRRRRPLRAVAPHDVSAGCDELAEWFR
jgi:hypothetical protein